MRGLLPHPLQPRHRFDVQFVEIGEILDKFLFQQLVDDLLAQAVDIHRVAPGKMKERFAWRRAGHDTFTQR